MSLQAADLQTRSFAASGLTVCGDVGGDPAHPVVVLLHGGGQTRHSWGGAQRELIEQGFYVLNLDARGHGESGWSATGDYTLKSLADDLLAVIAELPGKPALVGASMGAATSLYAIGLSLKPIARGLVMVDLVPRIDPVGSRRIRDFMSANPDGFDNLDQVADAVAAYAPHRPRPKDPAGLMKNLRRGDNGKLFWHWDPRMIRMINPPEPPDLESQMAEAILGVHVPTLLVRGMESDVVSDEGVAEFRRQLPQLEIIDVSGAGHMVAGDRNDAFNDAVIGFLRRLPAG